MGMLQELKATKFTDREIPGVGVVRIRHIKTKEMLALTEESDKKKGLRRLIAAAIYEGELPLFATEDDVNEVDWSVAKQMSDAAMDVNKLSIKDAEKNSTTPPSTP